jgi:2-iminobutanoate/2-iminopropanoate deaminase
MSTLILYEVAMKKIITSDKAPKAIGPYSQAVQFGNLVFFSGQLGINPETGKLAEGGVKAQAEQSLKNIKAILDEAGASVENVIKTTVFITKMDDFQEVNAAYSTVFNKDFPARSCVAVHQLPLNALVEIEIVVAV